MTLGHRFAGLLFLVAFAVAAPVASSSLTTALAATSPDEILEDPALEARARELGKELRCLVCQNQSIDDSNAPLARDLRTLVREQLVAGKSDVEILDYVTARYGDFVLLKPPVKPSTFGLWYGPVAIFLVAASGLALYLHRRRRQPVTITETEALTPEEQVRLDKLAGDPVRN